MKNALPRLTGVAVAGLLAVAPARAADPASISEAEFLSRLSDDHPASVSLREELAEAEGQRRTPRTENVDVSFEREAAEGVPSQSTVKLGWRPPLDGRRGLANERAAAALAGAESRLDWQQLRLREELREIFAQWWAGVERRDLFAGLEEGIGRLAGRARARASRGEESGLAAQRLELAAAESQVARAAAEAEVLAVQARVRALFPELDPETRLPSPPPLPVLPGSLDWSGRPDLAAARHDVERADLSRRLAGRWVEFPALVGGWTVYDGDSEVEDTDGPVLGLEWSLPLFDRRQGERARTEREAQVARARLELKRNRAAAEAPVAEEIYRHLRVEAVDVLEATGGVESTMASATAEFQAGEATLTDLLETLRSATDSRLAALDLYRKALAAHRELEAAVGRPLTDGGE
jgi:outer membrane protein TolC